MIKKRELCIYKKGNSGRIFPRIYYKDGYDYHSGKADIIQMIIVAEVVLLALSFCFVQISKWFLLWVSAPLLVILVVLIAVRHRVVEDDWTELFIKTKSEEQQKLRQDYLEQRENEKKTFEYLNNMPTGKLSTKELKYLQKLDYNLKYEYFI